MQQNSNYDIVQCYLYKSLPCSQSVCFAQLLLLFYLFIYCFFTWEFLLYLIAMHEFQLLEWFDSRIFFLYIPRADYSGPDILECKIIDLMDMEETLDFCLDVRTKFAQKDNFIFINSNSGLLHD